MTTQEETDLASLFDDPCEDQNALLSLAKTYLDARRFKDEAEAIEKQAGQRLEATKEQLIRAMKSAGVKSLKIDHDGKTQGLTHTNTTYYSLPAGGIDDESVLEWIEQAGGNGIVKHTVHHMTFSSFCREIKDNPLNGVGLHPLVKVLDRPGITVTKG